MLCQVAVVRVAKKPGNLEFDNLGKKNLENLEFCTKVVEKPGIFFNLNVLTILI